MCLSVCQIPQRTLLVSVLHRESGQVIAEQSLWAVRGLLGDGPELQRGAGAAAGAVHGLGSPSIREVRVAHRMPWPAWRRDHPIHCAVLCEQVNEFCERRHHTLLSELLLNSLRGEVAQAAERWPAHSRCPRQGHKGHKGHKGQESSSVDDVLLHDPVDGALSLLLLGDEGALELAFTASLKVRFVLQPIPAEPEVEACGRPWLRLALRVCLLQMRSLLVFSTASHGGPAPLSEAAAKASTAATARGKGPSSSAKDSSSSSSSSSSSLVRAAMDVLRRRVG